MNATTTAPPAPLVRTTNGIETPGTGCWLLAPAPAVELSTVSRWGGRRRRPLATSAGALRVDRRPGDLRIDLAGPGWRLQAAASRVRPGGRWTFHGFVTLDARTVPVTFDACYDGVHRHGAQAWARLTFDVALAGLGSPARGRHAARPDRSTLRVDVLFEAPATSRAFAATSRGSSANAPTAA